MSLLPRWLATQNVEVILHEIHAALVVRDPGTSVSVAAYDGLRKQVATVAAERRRHLVHLARVSAAVNDGTSVEDLHLLLEELRNEEGLLVVADPQYEEFFNFPPEPDNSTLYVTKPAYVALGDGIPPQVIKKGSAEWMPIQPQSAPPIRPTIPVDPSEEKSE